MEKQEGRIQLIAVSNDIMACGWETSKCSFMRKGWITWADTRKNAWDWGHTNHTEGICTLEGNKFCFNFNSDAFEIYYPSPYKRKLAENRIKRDEYIKQSEITHKIKLISI